MKDEDLKKLNAEIEADLDKEFEREEIPPLFPEFIPEQDEKDGKASFLDQPGRRAGS